jgi:hypothetical protein
MRPARVLPPLVLLAALAAAPAAAQGDIRAQGPAPLLSVTTGTPGGEPVPAVNIGSRLRYRRQSVSAKVTVSTLCPGQKFGLRLLALNPSVGTATSELALTDGMPPRDLVVSIPPGVPPFGTCVLQYTAAPLFSQGNSTELGPDVHLVTFTLVAQ